MLTSVLASALWAGGSLGTTLPPIPGAGTRDAAAAGVATSTGKTIPSAPATAHEGLGGGHRRIVLELVEITLRPGVRTQVIAGPDALEPGAIVLDATLRADALPATIWVGVPRWR